MTIDVDDEEASAMQSTAQAMRSGLVEVRNAKTGRPLVINWQHVALVEVVRQGDNRVRVLS